MGFQALGYFAKLGALKSDKTKSLVSGYIENKSGQLIDLSNRVENAVDIHKAFGKISKAKAGWTSGSYKYMGPYNPLEKKLGYNKYR